MMRLLSDLPKWLATLFMMPLLPARYRRKWPWTEMINETFSQWFNSILHAVLSIIVWEIIYTRFQKEFGDMVAQGVWEGAQNTPDMPSYFIYWAGILGFFAFPFTLKGAFVWTYLIDSVVRFVSMAMNRKHHASVFFVVPLWAVDRVKGLYSEGKMIEKYGSACEPDRIIETQEGMIIRCTRPHEEWHAQLAFSHKGSLYKLDSKAEAIEGKRMCFEYRFSPWPEREMTRRIVVLDSGTGDPAGRSSEKTD